MPNNALSPKQLILLFVMAFVVLPICAFVYANRNNPYAAKAVNEQVAVANPIALKTWLSPSVYTYTLERLQDFADSQENTVGSIEIVSPVRPLNGTYNFEMLLLPANTEHAVKVVVANFGGVVSTSVVIDGQQQSVAVDQKVEGVDFTGIDALVSSGISSAQANQLQSAIIKFNPDTYKAVIDSPTIRLNLGQGNNPDTVSFAVLINNQTYSASMKLYGLTASQLILKSDGQQVFDSGRIE